MAGAATATAPSASASASVGSKRGLHGNQNAEALIGGGSGGGRNLNADGSNSGHSVSMAARNRGCFAITMNASTWSGDSHGLFDYESRNVHKKSFRVSCLRDAYYVVRCGSDVQLLAEEDAMPYFRTNHSAKSLVKLCWQNGSYEVHLPSSPSPASSSSSSPLAGAPTPGSSALASSSNTSNGHRSNVCHGGVDGPHGVNSSCGNGVNSSSGSPGEDSIDNEYTSGSAAAAARAASEKLWLVVRAPYRSAKIVTGDVMKLGRFRLKVKEVVATALQAQEAASRRVPNVDDDECETVAPDPEQNAQDSNAYGDESPPQSPISHSAVAVQDPSSFSLNPEDNVVAVLLGDNASPIPPNVENGGAVEGIGTMPPSCGDGINSSSIENYQQSREFEDSGGGIEVTDKDLSGVSSGNVVCTSNASQTGCSSSSSGASSVLGCGVPTDPFVNISTQIDEDFQNTPSSLHPQMRNQLSVVASHQNENYTPVDGLSMLEFSVGAARGVKTNSNNGSENGDASDIDGKESSDAAGDVRGGVGESSACKSVCHDVDVPDVDNRGFGGSGSLSLLQRLQTCSTTAGINWRTSSSLPQLMGSDGVESVGALSQSRTRPGEDSTMQNSSIGADGTSGSRAVSALTGTSANRVLNCEPDQLSCPGQNSASSSSLLPPPGAIAGFVNDISDSGRVCGSTGSVRSSYVPNMNQNTNLQLQRQPSAHSTASILLRSIVSSQRVCRICLCDGEENGNPMVSPCKCKGSMQYVHLKCLRTWMQGRLNIRNDGVSFFWRTLDCELCKAPYPTFIEAEDKAIELLEIPRPEHPYIILEPRSNQGRGLHVVSLANRKEARLGRGHESDVRLNDISVSRQHAILKFQKGSFTLKDDESKFGTLVGLRKPLRLEPGNVSIALQVGRTVLSLSIKRQWRFIPVCLRAIKSLDSDITAFEYPRPPVMVSRSSPFPAIAATSSSGGNSNNVNNNGSPVDRGTLNPATNSGNMGNGDSPVNTDTHLGDGGINNNNSNNHTNGDNANNMLSHNADNMLSDNADNMLSDNANNILSDNVNNMMSDNTNNMMSENNNTMNDGAKRNGPSGNSGNVNTPNPRDCNSDGIEVSQAQVQEGPGSSSSVMVNNSVSLCNDTSGSDSGDAARSSSHSNSVEEGSGMNSSSVIPPSERSGTSQISGHSHARKHPENASISCNAVEEVSVSSPSVAPSPPAVVTLNGPSNACGLSSPSPNPTTPTAASTQIRV